nr:C. briggsae CBR-OSM-7 protein [Haemonchus contortus]
MDWTFCLILAAVLWKAESASDVVTVACSRRPELPFCKASKRDAHREVLSNRLRSLQERSEAKDIPMMPSNRQHAPTHPRFTAAQKRTNDQSRTPQTGGNLVVPPPLPKAATRKEQMEIMGSSSPENQIRGQTYGEIIDPKKLQLHSNQHRSHKNPDRASRSDEENELFRMLKAYNSMTAGPSTSSKRRSRKPTRAYQALTAEPSELAREEEEEEDTFKAISALSDRYGIHHQPRSRSPFTRPGLWEPNPDNPHNRDHANKWWYNPYSVTADWLNGQVDWGSHWAVPAVGVGGVGGIFDYNEIRFPSLGTFLGIPDDYD